MKITVFLAFFIDDSCAAFHADQESYKTVGLKIKPENQKRNYSPPKVSNPIKSATSLNDSPPFN